jgi:Radical SAM superfamily
LADRFRIMPDSERAVEIDPRITSREQLHTLRRLGFQRISLGVQDFSPVVQKAVNRLQSLEMVQQAVAWCRDLGFGSINFDLIYGLPFQTLDSMADTLDKTINLAPDRIAFYRLAVIPEIFRWQNVFRPQDLPAGDLPLDLNLLAIKRFQEAGYQFIGLDHFAKPEEGLARACREQTLHRNFQGMTTSKELELIGLGPSAISQLDTAFAQNNKTSGGWRDAVAKDLATERGLRLKEFGKLIGTPSTPSKESHMAKKKPAPKAAKKPIPKTVKKPAPKAVKKPAPKAKSLTKTSEPTQAEMADIISESQKKDELALEKIAALPVVEKFALELTMTQIYDMDVEIIKEGWTRETLMAAVANGTVEIVGLEVFVPSGEGDLEKAIARISRADEVDDATWEW